MRIRHRLSALLLILAISPGAALRAAPESEPIPESSGKTIVGSWRGETGEGNQIVATFHADGTVITSVATEVTLDPVFLTLTPTHGAWKHAGGRRYEVTVVGLLYDVPLEGVGTYQGYLEARVSLRLARGGNRLDGFDKVTFFDTEGNPLFEVPPSPTHYTRIQPKSFD
jgi:hypothetical protein